MTADAREAPQHRAGFVGFYGQHHERVLRLVYALCGDWQVAEDATQEAFIRAMRRWDTIGGYDRPDAWVRRVAINLVRSRFRRVTREIAAVTMLASRTEGTSAHVELAEDSEEFWAAVRSLPRRQAEAVALHYADDLPVVDVARVMDCAEGTVKAQLHAARQHLADRFSDDQENDR